MIASDFKSGDRVIYIPMHAEGNRLHADCEWGIVSSVNSKRVFVKFDKQVNKLGWEGTTSQACCPESLEQGEIWAERKKSGGTNDQSSW